MPALALAVAFASAPACRRRLAFSYSPNRTWAMSGVSPENGSLRSSAAAPAPVTRRRSRQSCGMARAQLASPPPPILTLFRHLSSTLSIVTSLPLRR